MKNCEICNSVFTSRNKEKLTCSKKCSYQLRGKGTAKKNMINIPKETIDKIKEILQYGYVYHSDCILHHLGNPFSYKPLNRILEENEDLRQLKEKVTYKNFPSIIQNLEKEKFEELLNDYKFLPYHKIAEKWKFPFKTTTRICNIVYKKNPRYKITDGERKMRYDRAYLEEFRKNKGSKSETWLEKVVRSILLCLDVDFLTQKHIKLNTFKCDFVIKNTNKLIEVNGDYWHGHDKKYEDLDLKVKESVDNYTKKLQFYSDNGYEVLEIWEHEIKNDLGEVIKKIKKYTQND